MTPSRPAPGADGDRRRHREAGFVIEDQAVEAGEDCLKSDPPPPFRRGGSGRTEAIPAARLGAGHAYGAEVGEVSPTGVAARPHGMTVLFAATTVRSIHKLQISAIEYMM
ncbi:hypothetical protein SSAG_01053 [Streptomyces sp. Mg1]|nr:hypothetical protein SSAG_01053 [Streptomyces sp. Mg1]